MSEGETPPLPPSQRGAPAACRLVLFDFDGTLADSFSTFHRCLEKAVKTFGLRPVEPGDLATLRGCSAREVIRYFGLRWWQVPLVARRVRRGMTADLARVRLFPGIADALRALEEQGVVLAIVSSNSEENVRRVLGPENAARIPIFECGASLFGKARRFRNVLRRTGIGAAQAICIGDEIRDSDAAKEAGIEFAAVGWGYTDSGALRRHSPKFLFKEPAEIPHCLL